MTNIELELRLIEHVLDCDVLCRVLSAAEEVALPDWYLVSGALPQSVWNAALDRPALEHVKDIDLVYFDARDLTKDTALAREYAVSERLSGIGIKLDAKNQARVHLWYEERFGYPIRPYRSAREAIATFPFTASSVGITRIDNALRVFAPFALDDLFAMMVRANRTLITPQVYARKAARVRVHWPDVAVLPWEAGVGPLDRDQLSKISRVLSVEEQALDQR